MDQFAGSNLDVTLLSNWIKGEKNFFQQTYAPDSIAQNQESGTICTRNYPDPL